MDELCPTRMVSPNDVVETWTWRDYNNINSKHWNINL